MTNRFDVLQKDSTQVREKIEASLRVAQLGAIPDASRQFSKETSLDLWRRMCRSRYFELGVIEAFQQKLVSSTVYLSLGQESIAAAVSICLSDHMIFAQHRCHDIYVSYGGSLEALRDELVGLPTGSSGGKAGSNCLQCHDGKITMFGHHGLIGENVPLAVGAALGSGRKTVCFFGDGAAEEDYISPSLGFAATHKLPIVFICVDNGLSILTPTETRRNWKISKVAEAFGIPSYDLADDPWSLMKIMMDINGQTPVFINSRTCRSHWHAGIGVDGPPEWDRFELVKSELNNLGLAGQALEFEEYAKREMGVIWDMQQLRIRLGK